MPYPESVILLAAMTAIAAATLWRPAMRFWLHLRFEKARALFHRERERLEARLVKQITVPVVTGEMEWLDCEFDDQVTFLRDRQSGAFVALVAIILGPQTPWVVVSDEESRGHGVAIFRFHKNHWVADPKVHMNLTPDEVVQEFGGRMELVRRETGQ